MHGILSALKFENSIVTSPEISIIHGKSGRRHQTELKSIFQFCENQKKGPNFRCSLVSSTSLIHGDASLKLKVARRLI